MFSYMHNQLKKLDLSNFNGKGASEVLKNPNSRTEKC